ncbi:DnaB-like helicase C-terminal domain-containing protein [Pseudomonas aeruginosa]
MQPGSTATPLLILVDYLQLMRCPGLRKPATEISEISRSLKALVRRWIAPSWPCPSSISLENRPNKRPNNADLRESGAIEQDADVIMFVYRDGGLPPQHRGPGASPEIIIGKYRNGPDRHRPLPPSSPTRPASPTLHQLGRELLHEPLH